MDEELRHLERRAKSSDDTFVWDSYITALIRAGKIEALQQRFAETAAGNTRAPKNWYGWMQSTGCAVSYEDYQLLIRYIAYQCRNDAFRPRAFEILYKILYPIHINQGLNLPRKQNHAGGYFCVNYPDAASQELGGVPQYLPKWMPVRIAPKLSPKPERSRIFLPCPCCTVEIPIRDRLTHLRTHLL